MDDQLRARPEEFPLKVWILPERVVSLLAVEEVVAGRAGLVVVAVVVVERAGLVVVEEGRGEWMGKIGIDMDRIRRHRPHRRRRVLVELEEEEVGGALEVELLAFPRCVLEVEEGLKEQEEQEEEEEQHVPGHETK